VNRQETLRIENLKKHYPIQKGFFSRAKGTVKAVDGVSLIIAEREILGLVGESGCGKTTLGRVILRIEEPTEGTILYNGRNITKMGKEKLRQLREEMQIIFQDPYSSLNPRYTVSQLIKEPLIVHGIGDSLSQQQRVLTLIREVGLQEEYLNRYPHEFSGGEVGLQEEYLNRYPHEFSGGQRQRIGIARALSLNPKFMVCDEPVSALDVSIQAQVINLLMDLQKNRGLTYLFISHDLSVVEHLCNRIAVMYLGRIVEMAPTSLLREAARHHYTKALLSASPIANPNLKRKRIILTGDVPNPITPPTGCHFHTRCPEADQQCQNEVPALLEVEPEHWICCFKCD
jgi:oligopeptide/dipeptide ABC transporter ATP-binding protein